MSRITIKEIQQAFCAEFGISLDEMLCHKKFPHYLMPRLLAMAVARRITDKSFPYIGRLFQRDHATIISACNKHRKDLEEIMPTIPANATAQQLAAAFKQKLCPKKEVAPCQTDKMAHLILERANEKMLRLLSNQSRIRYGS